MLSPINKDEWFVMLCTMAEDWGYGVLRAVEKSELYYITTYFDEGISPEEALEEEWG